MILSVIATKLSESVTGMAEKMTYKQYAVEGKKRNFTKTSTSKIFRF